MIRKQKESSSKDTLFVILCGHSLGLENDAQLPFPYGKGHFRKNENIIFLCKTTNFQFNTGSYYGFTQSKNLCGNQHQK